jgi:hypothetical protein
MDILDAERRSEPGRFTAQRIPWRASKNQAVCPWPQDLQESQLEVPLGFCHCLDMSQVFTTLSCAEIV